MVTEGRGYGGAVGGGGAGAPVDLLTAAMPCNLVELPSETMASVNWFPLSSALGNGVASALDPNPVLQHSSYPHHLRHLRHLRLPLGCGCDSVAVAV